jgi:hypothetical protein
MPEIAVPAAAFVYRPLVQDRVRRLADDTRRLLRRTARRACSAPLGLAWQLDVTVELDAEVAADDRDTAAQLFQQYLRRAAARIVVSRPSVGPTGWRDIACTPVTQLRDITVEDNADVDAAWPWSVAAAATVRFTLPARDADVDLYLHIEPDPCPGMGYPIQRIDAYRTASPARRCPAAASTADPSLTHAGAPLQAYRHPPCPPTPGKDVSS